MPGNWIKFMKELYMEKKIKLSIIIVNFNTQIFLDKCLKSISESNLFHDDFEVMVVDNASKEECKLKDHNLQIKLIKNKEKERFATVNNQGIKIAKGEYILLLNPDTVIPSDTISFMINFMDSNPKVGIATCKVLLESGELDDASHRGMPTPWNAFCQFFGLAKLFPFSKFLNGYHLGYCQLDKTHEIDACAGAFMLVRKIAGEKINWLDENYFWYGEDLDFCFRVKQAGWKIMFVPEVQITHYKGVSGGIKKHSQQLSTADNETKLLATKARFEVMRIFYSKHYKDKYPKSLTRLILAGIRVKEYINLLKYN